MDGKSVVFLPVISCSWSEICSSTPCMDPKLDLSSSDSFCSSFRVLVSSVLRDFSCWSPSCSLLMTSFCFSKKQIYCWRLFLGERAYWLLKKSSHHDETSANMITGGLWYFCENYLNNFVHRFMIFTRYNYNRSTQTKCV